MLDVDGTADGNVEGSFVFDGTEDSMHYGSLDSNGSLTQMALTKASSMAHWAWTERLAGLGCTEDGIDNGVLAWDSMDEDKFEGLLDSDSTAN